MQVVVKDKREVDFRGGQSFMTKPLPLPLLLLLLARCGTHVADAARTHSAILERPQTGLPTLAKACETCAQRNPSKACYAGECSKGDNVGYCFLPLPHGSCNSSIPFFFSLCAAEEDACAVGAVVNPITS